MTDGVMVTSLSASLQHKTRVTKVRVCHIALNQKLSHTFKSGLNFQAALQQNHAQTNCVKRDLPVLYRLGYQE
jgi:hypothetical protein